MLLLGNTIPEVKNHRHTLYTSWIVHIENSETGKNKISKHLFTDKIRTKVRFLSSHIF